MRYILKKESSDLIKKKYKNSYFVKNLDRTDTYISLIINRKKEIPKHMALAFVKTLDNNAEIEDIFDEVK